MFDYCNCNCKAEYFFPNPNPNRSFFFLLSSGVVGAGKANEMFSELGSNVEKRSF